MGLLSGRQIVNFVKDGHIKIDPFNEGQVQPASFDLRIGTKVLASPLSELTLGKAVDLTRDKPSYDIQPGQMVGVISYEKIELPLDICGKFGIRSSFARRGINSFGGLQIDPGFKGRLTMNLLNVGPEPIAVTLHELLFSVEFQRLEEPAEFAYAGPFQDQDDFPADQLNFIVNAHTTSLAEIPTIRKSLANLTEIFEEFEEWMPDPDQGLRLKPEIERRVRDSSEKPKDSLLSRSEMRKKLGI